ncbi:MAG: tetratricopeptide repeat protein [Sulfurospirillum sp.]|nr:tetratricopeptide repeat protein [Sulfurospirillum sp.]MBL0702783.1 tetratricopeptide repeat protein [Sulfurospirillum sp.]
MNKYLKRGISSFYKKDFLEALLYFSLALKEQPDSKEARISAMLSEFGISKKDEAIALYEYYLINKDSGVENSEEIIEEIIDSIDFSLESLETLFLQDEIEAKINEENGIAYEDFKTYIDNKKSFKEAFEDIMFSTKVIIYKKDDFIDFLEKLIDNGFKDLSMNYFESAVGLYPHDERLQELVKKVES